MFVVANEDLCSATKKIPFFKPVCERVIGASAELLYSGLQLCSDSPLFDTSFHEETTNRELPNGKWDTKVAQTVWQFDNLSFQTKQADNLFSYLLNNFIQQKIHYGIRPQGNFQSLSENLSFKN